MSDIVCVHVEWLSLLPFAVADVSKGTYHLCLMLNLLPQKVHEGRFRLNDLLGETEQLMKV